MTSIKTICVCGAGTMGSGIALTAAQYGFATIQYDVNEAMLAKSKSTIQSNLGVLFAKEKITHAQQTEIFNRLIFTNDINDCKADVIIEAIVENLEIKARLFNQLATINSAQTIFATNTSSLSISALQTQIDGPERVAGFHFFNPAQVMKLVEVVQGKNTHPEVTNALVSLAVQLGKTPVQCNDSPGFIVNRVARPYYLEAMRLLENNVATAQEIDAILEATGFKMGPFKLMDLIGLDINYAVSDIVWKALEKPKRLQPSPIQAALVTNGKLGRKTGQGFYNYSKSE